MKLVGANVKATVTGAEELPGKSNYFIGNDPKKWRTNVPSYARVKYEGVYPGVDLVYYGNQRQLEYDLVVAPGADPNQIKLSFAGADGMRLDAASGDLVLKVGDDEVRFHKPAVYQPATTVAAVYDRRTREPEVLSTLAKPDLEPRIPHPEALSGTFVLASNNEIAFRVAGYDPKRALVIDPVLSYSTFLGGSNVYEQGGNGIAVDSAGNAYVTGHTIATDFPTTTGVVQPTCGGSGADCMDVFVTKLNPTGSALVYSTYLGGTYVNGGSQNVGLGIAVDTSGNAYVTGYTGDSDFPTVNPLQPSIAGSDDAFVAKLNPTGSALVYSTYLGGGCLDEGWGIAVDRAGSAYVAGLTCSDDFPTTTNAFQATSAGMFNAFVAKLNAAGSAVVYSTYLGGSNQTEEYGANAIAVDSSGNVYVTGTTFSTDFPTVNPIQGTCNNCSSSTDGSYNYSGFFYWGGPHYTDAFVAKLNAAGSALVYSTYLGGSDFDFGYGIAVDPSGNAYVTGLTYSTDFPTANPLQATNKAAPFTSWWEGGTAFVAELNSTGSALVYSTYLGGSNSDYAWGIAVDSSGNAYVTGVTYSNDFPSVNPVPANNWRFPKVFVAELNTGGSALVYSTSLGGNGADWGQAIAVDSSGSAYVTGFTQSADFPTVNPFQATLNAGTDAFVTKISPGAPSVGLSPASVTFGPQNVGTTSAPQTVTLSNTGESTLSVSSIVASGDFAQTNNCGTSVAAGGNCTISVTFAPTSIGAGTGTITITGNAPGSPQTVSLTGTGRTGPFVSLTSTWLFFGRQSVGTTSVPQTATLTNTGNASLTILSITASGDFSQVNDCGGSVAAGGNCTISVTFTPTSIQGRFGAITVTDNASDSPQTVGLAGRGMAASVTLSSNSLTFAPQNVGTTSAPQTETVTNTGGGNLTISAVTMGGTNASEFAKSADTCTGATVTPNGACTISVTFTPVGRTGLGAQTASISITDNAASSPQSVSLSGMGIDAIPPAISISANPSTLWPPNGKSVPVTVSGAITDSGSGVNPSTLACNVVDEYGLVQPACSVGPLGTGGAYSFKVSLVASRNGNDKNGRSYTISVSASGYAGNPASVSTTVIVPHDQGR